MNFSIWPEKLDSGHRVRHRRRLIMVVASPGAVLGPATVTRPREERLDECHRRDADPRPYLAAWSPRDGGHPGDGSVPRS